jgi:hypothetical protein
MAPRKQPPPAVPDGPQSQRIIGHGLRAIREALDAHPWELAGCTSARSAHVIEEREHGNVALTPEELREHLAALVLLATRVR